VDTGSGGSTGSAGTVFTRLMHHLLALLEARVQLTRREVRAAARDVVLAGWALLAAMTITLLLIPVAVATMVLLLAHVVAPWIATGAVLLAMMLAAGGLFLFARSKLRRRRLTLWRGFQEDWESIRRGFEERR
jgi:membrane protein YdbS with pleckstrin-like domain